MIKTDEHTRFDLSEAEHDKIEAELADVVRFYWEATRRGPHDECLCHESYVWELKRAIKRLRLFRRTGEWHWISD